MQKTHWDKEEFEELVATGLIAMYETKFKKYKWAMKCARITPEILQSIRKIGCYFEPDDRVVMIDQHENGVAKRIQQLDVVNEDRPEYALTCWSKPLGNEAGDDSMRKNCYLEITYLQRISHLPSPIQCDHDGRRYRLTKVWMYNDKCIEGMNYFVVIDHEGNIYDTYWIRQQFNQLGVGKRVIVNSAYTQSQEESDRSESIETIDAHVTIQNWNDRKHLWNVVANEGNAKATFGVYPDQIQSLFYAREMPMTETGRKRPILHWVAAHQRRLKNGIDVDIEKHLRGINEFVYQGTKFKITRPLKNVHV